MSKLIVNFDCSQSVFSEKQIPTIIWRIKNKVLTWIGEDSRNIYIMRIRLLSRFVFIYPGWADKLSNETNFDRPAITIECPNKELAERVFKELLAEFLQLSYDQYVTFIDEDINSFLVYPPSW